MRQIDNWSNKELFLKMYPYEVAYLYQLEKEGFIGNVNDFVETMVETWCTLQVISEALEEYLKSLKTVKREYFEDPDDPPVQRIGETLYFVRCENYMTSFGLIEFNLNNVLFKTNFIRKYADFNFTQKALEEIPEIPPNEYMIKVNYLEDSRIHHSTLLYHTITDISVKDIRNLKKED
jgi:hypothetical protein